jgi:23S rRNA (pseudouridine1915-N3)-methyltransferase
MKLWLVAVGQRQPAWAETAYADFAKRFPPEMRLELKGVKAEPRGGKTAEQLMAAEAARIEAAVPRGARRVVLDEAARRPRRRAADRRPRRARRHAEGERR